MTPAFNNQQGFPIVKTRNGYGFSAFSKILWGPDICANFKQKVRISNVIQ